MLRASQLALAQQANQQLVNIRQLEMDYFISILNSFALIATVVGNNSINVLTQIDVKNETVNIAFTWIFCITMMVNLTVSVHCVLTSLFTVVFGTGLAIRGPAGSMVRTVEGMIKEMDGIFMSFLICMGTFQLELIGICFYTMRFYAAYICTLIFLIGSYYYYAYCKRIMNRFKINKVVFNWADTEDGPRIIDETEDQSGKVSALSPDRTYTGTKAAAATSTVQREPSSVVPAKLRQEGFLTYKELVLGKVFNHEQWKRYYFVLDGSELYYYNNKQEFLRDPEKSVKNRPINIEMLDVREELDNKARFNLNLVPLKENDLRKPLQFRCDTAEEMNSWAVAFKTVLSSTK